MVFTELDEKQNSLMALIMAHKARSSNWVWERWIAVDLSYSFISGSEKPALCKSLETAFHQTGKCSRMLLLR